MRHTRTFQNWPEAAIIAAVIAVPTGITLAGIHLYNRIANNREIITESQRTFSQVNGLMGHIEFTQFLDGSYDVKVYPSSGHRYGKSELDQDLNGDSLVDRIRVNRSGFYANKLDKLLVRETDYKENQELFIKADQRLNQLIQRYSPELIQ